MNPDGDYTREPHTIDHSAPRTAPRGPMTADTVRHFQGEDGRVVSAGPKMAGYYIAHPGFAEVQPAPLNAVVIEGPLPEVVEEPNSILRVDDAQFDPIGCNGKSLGADHFERSARRYLAIAAHLRENPPADEAQVEAIRTAYRKAYPQSGGLDQPGARRLYGEGVRVEEVR